MGYHKRTLKGHIALCSGILNTATGIITAVQNVMGIYDLANQISFRKEMTATNIHLVLQQTTYFIRKVHLHPPFSQTVESLQSRDHIWLQKRNLHNWSTQ